MGGVDLGPGTENLKGMALQGTNDRAGIGLALAPGQDPGRLVAGGGYETGTAPATLETTGLAKDRDYHAGLKTGGRGEFGQSIGNPVRAIPGKVRGL